MVTYQFEIDDETWAEWKDTVPRRKTLDERLIELIHADTEGRVLDERPPVARAGGEARRADADEADPAPVDDAREDEHTADLEAALEDVQFPEGRDREACVAAIRAAHDYLRETGKASMRDFVVDIMPEHPLGYDVPELEPGDRYRGAWWRRVVRPGLEALEDIDPPGTGGQKWTYAGAETGVCTDGE